MLYVYILLARSIDESVFSINQLSILFVFYSQCQKQSYCCVLRYGKNILVKSILGICKKLFLTSLTLCQITFLFPSFFRSYTHSISSTVSTSEICSICHAHKFFSESISNWTVFVHSWEFTVPRASTYVDGMVSSWTEVSTVTLAWLYPKQTGGTNAVFCELLRRHR